MQAEVYCHKHKTPGHYSCMQGAGPEFHANWHKAEHLARHHKGTEQHKQHYYAEERIDSHEHYSSGGIFPLKKGAAVRGIEQVMHDNKRKKGGTADSMIEQTMNSPIAHHI